MDCPSCSRCFGKAVIDFAELRKLEELTEKTLEAQLLKVQKMNDRKAYLRNYQAKRRELIKEGKWLFKGEESGKGEGGILRTRRKATGLNLSDLKDLLEANGYEAEEVSVPSPPPTKAEGQSHLKDSFEDTDP